jgi:hypothetical protein
LRHDEQEYRAAVWDPGTGTIVVQDVLWDMFCNGMAALPDGRWVIVGGNEQYDPFCGEPRATVFDPATERFNEVENMAHGRWYATVTDLSIVRSFRGEHTDGTNYRSDVSNDGFINASDVQLVQQQQCPSLP